MWIYVVLKAICDNFIFTMNHKLLDVDRNLYIIAHNVVLNKGSHLSYLITHASMLRARGDSHMCIHA